MTVPPRLRGRERRGPQGGSLGGRKRQRWRGSVGSGGLGDEGRGRMRARSCRPEARFAGCALGVHHFQKQRLSCQWPLACFQDSSSSSPVLSSTTQLPGWVARMDQNHSGCESPVKEDKRLRPDHSTGRVLALPALPRGCSHPAEDSGPTAARVVQGCASFCGIHCAFTGSP